MLRNMTIVGMTDSWTKATNRHHRPTHHHPSLLLPKDHHRRSASAHLSDTPPEAIKYIEALMDFCSEDIQILT